MSRWLLPLVLVLLAVVAAVSCSKKTTILSEKEMEALLFDYHIAQGMLRQENADSVRAAEVTDALFAKHNTTREVFDSSMVYYATHADKLYDMYSHLADRLTNLGRQQGIENSALVSAFTESGDTTNIWSIDPSVLLTAYVPNNLFRYSFPADSTFFAGDHFLLSFTPTFLYQGGSRNGLAVISLRLDDDSIITRTKTLSQTTPQTLDVAAPRGANVAEIRGYFMLRTPAGEKENSNEPLRLMVLSDITLLKMHLPTGRGNNKE